MSTTKNSNENGRVIGRDRAPMISYNLNGVHFTPRMERLPDGTWRPCKGFLEFMEEVKKEAGENLKDQVSDL
jgi:hypothetical protein